jgi:DNA-binding XRE family transcriptional regulator
MDPKPKKRRTRHDCLKQLRKECGLGQQEMTKMIGLKNWRSLANIETGQRPLTWEIAMRIQGETGASAKSLLDTAGRPTTLDGRPFTAKDYADWRAVDQTEGKDDDLGRRLYLRGAKEDIRNSAQLLTHLLGCAQKTNRLSSALTSFRFWAAAFVADFDLADEIKRLPKMSASERIALALIGQHAKPQTLDVE